MVRATSPFSKGVIVSCQENNIKPQQCLELLQRIKEKQGETFVCSIQTINKIYEKWKKEQSIDTHYQNCQRPKLYSQQVEQNVVEQFKNNPTSSLRKIQQNPQSNPSGMSHQQISNVLKKSGLNAYKIPKVQLMTEAHKNQRLAFAKSVKAWTSRWKKVIFTDESILKKGKIGNKYVWYSDRSEIDPQHCQQLEKYPKQRLHVWGAISYEKTLYLQQINGNLNSQSYIQILKDFINHVGDDELDSKIFQQDQASCHISKVTTKFIKDNFDDSLNWPTKGADLSPIERIWASLKEEMNELNDDIQGEQLFKAINTIFLNSKKIQLQIKRLYTSLPQKIRQVITAQGNQIKF